MVAWPAPARKLQIRPLQKSPKKYRQRASVAAAVAALVDVPAEVGESARAGSQQVDLLPAGFAHVCDVERSRGAVEGEPRGIAQAVGEDDGPRDASVDVEPEELAVEVGRALGSVLEPVSDPRVETAVRAECELAAEVTEPAPLRLPDLQDHPACARVDRPLTRAVLLHEDVVACGGVEDEQSPVGLIAWVEGDRQESLEALPPHSASEVEEDPEL